MRLGESSLSDSERATEAKKLLNELISHSDIMEGRASGFVKEMHRKQDQANFWVSPNQLFWMRDLYQRYCV